MDVDKKSLGLGVIIGIGISIAYLYYLKNKNVPHNPSGVNNNDNQIKGVKQ
jgi:hypothetical protein